MIGSQESDQELKNLSTDVIELLKKRDEKKRSRKASRKNSQKAEQAMMKEGRDERKQRGRST